MLKQGIKKLGLRHEAIRTLSGHSLAGAHGGSNSTASPPLATSGDTGSGEVGCLPGGTNSHQNTCHRTL